MTRLLTATLAVALCGSASAQLEPDRNAPLSSVVAINADAGVADLPTYVRSLADDLATGQTLSIRFPLPNRYTRNFVRNLTGTRNQVLVRWLDPLTQGEGALDPRFGSNCDYVAYFGEGWDSDWTNGVVGSAPQYAGSGDAGWMWVNHEYISNSLPSPVNAPSGQHMTLAKFLFDGGVLSNDVTSSTWPQDAVDTYVNAHKRQLGGSWIRIVKGANGLWSVDRDADNKRYTSTDSTLSTITGHELRPSSPSRDHNDDGTTLPEGVVVGSLGNCSGGQTPWGTVLTAEENVQGYYGDLEPTWSSNQQFLPGNGFDAGSNVCPNYEPSTGTAFGLVSTVQNRHNRDVYGFLTEIDPSTDTNDYYESVANGGDGLGNRKVGSMGRARWENSTVATGADWQLVDGQNVVIYGGNDRRGGRIWKWISAAPYTAGMTRAEVRALLDEGSLYVAHLEGLDHATGFTMAATGESPTEAQPGIGRWVEMSVDSTDLAPNAAALGAGTTVGEALQDIEWNSIGGFPDDNTVRSALFTAATKVGVTELNRPEDLEWNANDVSGTPRLYVAFTNHTRRVANDQQGVLYDPATHSTNSPNRDDSFGSIFALEEADASNPANSGTFEFFIVWKGTEGQGPYDAAAPDNLMIDPMGGVWFGTDGNFSRNGTNDAVYYIDQDPAHAAGAPGVVEPTFGRALRVAAVPADAEATGPTLSADGRTLFLAVQHPGEDTNSQVTSWPQ